jgi:hypothetical protein
MRLGRRPVLAMSRMDYEEPTIDWGDNAYAEGALSPVPATAAAATK